jgi:hypothetical protein
MLACGVRRDSQKHVRYGPAAPVALAYDFVHWDASGRHLPSTPHEKPPSIKLDRGSIPEVVSAKVACGAWAERHAFLETGA